MCYWVGTRKFRELLLQNKQRFSEDEIARLFHESFLAPDKTLLPFKLQEHSVAIGKAKPLLTSIVKKDNLLTLQNLEWTLQWTYFDNKSNQEKAGRPLLNATCENIFWQHKNLIYSQRCVIPIDGYWEFLHLNGKTYPYFIHAIENIPLYVGGVYNRLVDKKNGEISETMAFITTPPNELAKTLHNNPKAPNGPRMLLLLNPNEIIDFLNPELNKFDLQKHFFKPFDNNKLKAHPTVRFLKKEHSDYLLSDKVQAPFYYPELAG